MIFHIVVIVKANISNYNPNNEFQNQNKHDFDTTFVIFDSLSCVKKKAFIKNNKVNIKNNVQINKDNLSNISNIDSLFSILVSVRIDSLNTKRMLPFNVYIITQIVRNKNLDGYIGEFLSDMYYNLFIKYPGYFYQYIDYLDIKKDTDVKEQILSYVSSGLYFNDIDDTSLELLFDLHKQYIKNKKKEISYIETYFKKHTP